MLTGFNQAGYWRLLYGRPILAQCQIHKAGEVIRWLHKQQFVLNEGQFLGYGLTGKHSHTHHYIELMGNRWWPHLAALYALVLEKRTIPLTPIIDYQALPYSPVLAQVSADPSGQINDNI